MFNKFVPGRLGRGITLLTFLAYVTGLCAEQVVFTEVMYNPVGTKPEYIEVYNQTSTPFDIAGWRFSSGVEFVLPPFDESAPERSFLSAFERVVFSSAAEDETRAAYGIPEQVRVFGPWSGRLDNAGERIVLEDKNGVVVCALEYDDSGDWLIAADGKGHSLVVKNPNKPIDDWRNWDFSRRKNGSPGFESVAQAETRVPSPEVNLNEGVVFVDYDQVWKYNDRAVDLGEEWRESDYDAGDWESGPGLLGFEDSGLPWPGLQTVLDRNQDGGNNSTITFYFRTEFDFHGEPSEAVITVDQILDDGAVYYLNGEELFRSAMQAGDIDFNTTASRTVGNATEETAVFTGVADALRQGRNVLAVEAHQTGPGSSDIVFGSRLKIAVPHDRVLMINEVLPGADGDGFIELYNPGADDLDIQGFHVTDDPADLTKQRIDENVIVPAGGLKTISYTGVGLTPANPVVIYLVGKDGNTVVCGIRADMPLDGRSIGRKPAGGDEWYLFVDPTPGMSNESRDALGGALQLNEVRFADSNTLEWLEIMNMGTADLALEGLYLEFDSGADENIPLSGSIAPLDFYTMDLNVDMPADQLRLFLVTENGAVLDAELIERRDDFLGAQAYPDGSSEWYAAGNSSRGVANSPERATAVVINEIMYDPPSDQVDGEYIELYNRSDEAVDLSRWRIEDGVDFRFSDGVIIPPREYLVVAADADRVGRIYDDVQVVGDYDRRLSNRGERIRLLDGNGNLADEVDYRVGGDWPYLANGGGSSMELINPWMDNNRASAWKDSDETDSGEFRHFSVKGVYQEINSLGSPSDYKELNVHLVNDGHAVLKNIELVRSGEGNNLIENVDRLSSNGYSADGWLCQGTHWASHFEGDLFHVIADGRGDNEANRTEIDVAALEAGSSYEIRFDARWVSECPRLIVETWDHSISKCFRLDIPEDLGTPGRRNSAFVSNPQPQVDGVLHSPAVPTASDTVKVTASVYSHAALDTVELVHRPDSFNGDEPWRTKKMFDDGLNGGDEVAGDGTFSAELTEYESHGRIVQFFVRAESGDGLTCTAPRDGAQRPAMYVVENRDMDGDVRLSRFVVSEHDMDIIANGNSARHDYKFPRLSNHYFNATYIVNERQIYYNALIRPTGSPWTRKTNLDHCKFKLPDDRRFRGHYKYALDNDAGGGNRYHNRMVRHLLYLIGHPANENEFVRMVVNTGGAALKEETEPVANDFLDRVFENGSEGDLYRIDDEWWMTDDWSRRNRNADWKFKGTFAPGRYWTEWMKRTKETEFDYSDLISFFYQITRNRYSREEINRIIDPYATLQMCAVRGFVGDWDSFSLNRGKNGYFYRRYSDGRFQFLHWDSDLAFRDTNGPFYNGVPGFPLWMSKGYNQKIFWDYIAELVKKYTAGSARVSAWMDAEEDASSMYSINKGFYENYFDDRARFARSEMNDGLSRDFYCVLDGRVVETRYDEFNISGSAPYGVFNVIAVGHPEAEFEWISDINWDLKNVRLHAGTNHVTIQALDAEGTPIHEAQTTLIKTTPAPPVIDIQAQPASWHVELSETFTIDATESRDLDGGDLELEWSVTPSAGVLLDTNRYGRCAMTFSSPGNYTVKLIATADSGERTSFLREVSVFAPGDFDSFAGSSLSDKWMLENLAQRGNTPAASWISLLMKPGFLTMKTQDNSIKPLNTSEAFLRLVRPIPTDTDWAFETELELENRFFGYFDTGLIITTLEDGVTNRYTLGVQDGALLSVKRIIESGATNEVTELKVVKWNADSAKIRVRRLGGYLTFERFENNGWLSLCARQIGEDAVASSAGLFSATDTMAQNLEVNFDYAMLVVPDLEQPAENLLKITEIMYNPVGGEDYEFIELLNAGTNTINLEGFEFTDGIYYVFPETELAPGKRIVVVRNRDAFISRYGDTGITIAEGEYSGKLANDGERLVLTDPDGYDLITIEYSDSGAWPARADGLGGSLEIIDQHGDPNNPANWRASARYNGSPGAAPIDAAPRVVINEVLANTDYPLEDAVELFNNSSEPVDISGWYLSDDSENLRKYEIPDGSIIEPNDYIVFYEYQFNSNNNANPFSLNGNEGEEAILVSADAGGNLEYFIDSLEFGLMENGVALGRYPNGIGDFAPMCWITLGVEVDLNDPNFTNDEFISGGGAPNAYPIVGPVVFNEIMYHPNEDGTLEYVVITNITEEEVLLFDPAHATNVWKLANAVEFEFDPATIIPAGGKLVVSCVEPDVLREVYDIESQTPIQGPWNGRLDNSGETIELRRSAAPVVMDDGSGFVPYILVERISYKPVSPWPIEADGLGPSLKRIDPTLYGNDPSNWSTEWIEAMRDEDGDGMDDDWELQFGLNPDNPGDAVGDEDGDGQTNLSEFIAGTDPTNPDSLFLVDAVLGDGDHVILDFTAQPQRRYVIESTDALDSEVWSEVGVIQPKQNEQPIQYIDERPLNASRFYRVRVFLER